jgi:branched-chain amino acid transport system substrate-binding protein
MKVGVLFPQSNTYPGIGQDFMDGWNSLFKCQGINEVTVLKEGIGLGGVEKEVYLKAEKLLISDDVDVLVAYVDEKVLPVLYPLAMSTGKLLLVVNPGANYPLNWIAQPTVVHLNLQHAFLCQLSGALAAATGNGKAALATTYYDCGYLQSASMVSHFMEKGGSMQYNYINNQLYNEHFDINALRDFLVTQTDCNNLLCVFDSLPASLFYQLLNQDPAGRPLHLFVSPMMLTDKATAAIAQPAPYNVAGYLPWYPDLDTAANETFVKACNRPVSIFSLLGWETALVLQQLLQSNTITDGEAAVAHLKANPLQSARGTLQLDAATQHYLAPAASYSLSAGATTPKIEWISNLQKEWQAFTALATEGAVTGWTNTYLCY